MFMLRLSVIAMVAVLSLSAFQPAAQADAQADARADAQAAAQADDGVDPQATYQKMVDRAVRFLRTKGRAPDGSYSAEAGPGVTALVTIALLRSGRAPDDPLIAKSLEYLEGFVRADGGIYKRGSLYRNYETCLAMLCFAEANREGRSGKEGRYDKIIAKADAFVKGLQWDQTESHEKDSYSYGGAGYGKHKRPDLSNTSFLMDALKAAGNGPDDEAVKKALLFVSRCQNLESKQNTTKFAAKNPDGGFYYTPAAGGQSQAGETANGGLRSYGSMTYAGLKSMIYAGVGPDDPRVKATLDWIGKHYGLDSNPGMGQAGLYYYYHTFAKALHAAGLKEIVGTDGKRHDWRKDLIEELARRQRADGSWINENSRWMEAMPNLTTAYALLSLTYCRLDEGKAKR